MERERLEEITYEQLKEEAIRYQLKVSSNRSQLMDSIMDNFHKNSPLEELAQTKSQSTKAAAPKSKQGCAIQNPGPSQAVGSSDQLTIRQLAESFNICLEQQSYMMKELRALSHQRNSNATDSVQERDDPELARSPMMSPSSPAQAVDLLAPQIPEFGGTDEENVQVWTLRIDKVAQVHRASDDVTLPLVN